ncbi:Up-regulated during septation-domain-containing protein [Annulohypoxylon maeteangense]|uniref:Up-regulated during septation-domain-containing protein n=1 Tax=Annulohypoxylon maeteangense TaxID=1927788 RepID=UPI0020083970|nr:Up-regulated during septation-domain-containing protein [Annulohypoxylon maeteangense]KAI0884863.1 Up-regulated during septation-domain-containing protein [Annulohypoxylon maeteangense]
MNGFSSRGQNDFESVAPPPLRPRLTPRLAPRGPALVESYREDGMNGFEKDPRRFNPMNPNRVQSSVLVDLKDPVQVHLLTETALLDSKEYEILSQEEVDDLKKQCQILNQRIEQTRANLAIQSKYRDAAISMSKLYSPTRPDTKRRSLLGHRHSGSSDAAKEAEHELTTIQRKCEDLASELWSLEKRAMEPQKRLLEHTAGILQLTHKTAKKSANPSPRVPLLNGVPASPESMYTTSNGRDSLGMDFLEDGFTFDEASLYRSFDQSDRFNNQFQQSTIEIPMKSPIRGQNKQLTEESERLREENRELRAQAESLLRGSGSTQWKLISDTESKLENFNRQLRDMVVNADPAKNGNYMAVPSGQLEPGDMIGSHLEYLENVLAAISGGRGNTVQMAGKIQTVNAQIQGVLLEANITYPPPPDVNLGVEDQLGYLRESLQVVEDELRQGGSKSQGAQSEPVLMGLWDMIQTGYAGIRQRRQERRKARMEKGLDPDEDEMSDGESFDANEPFSLLAFETKIQWLYRQATKLQEQKCVLKRQVKQQRELNSRSDSEKDQALRDKMDEIEEIRELLHRAEKETDNVRSQLSIALEDIEKSQKDRTEESAAMDEARGQLKERNAKIASLEAGTRDVQARLVTAEANIVAITAQLQEASDARDVTDKAVKDKENELKAKDEELAQMTGMVAELKMEATLAKAELDGAYGSRKERAAEVAALHNNSESSKMQNRVNILEKELKATAKDLTDIVKQSVESEKKIGELENELDRVKAERSKIKDEKDAMNEELERRLREATTDIEESLGNEIARLRKEKEQIQDELDKERLGSARMPLSPGGTNKTSYLTDSYRSGLRAERKKYEEQLRAEQMVRRKLEDELRTLKRAQGPGKSPLSPR